MYWVHWNTRNAKLARKSLAESRPATGRSMNPVCSVCVCGGVVSVRDQHRVNNCYPYLKHFMIVVTFQEA